MDHINRANIKIILIFMLFVTLFSVGVSAMEPCGDYTKDYTRVYPAEVYVFDNHVQDPNKILTIQNTFSERQCLEGCTDFFDKFQIVNNLNTSVDAEMSYILKGSETVERIMLPPLGSLNISQSRSENEPPSIDFSSIKLKIIKNSGIRILVKEEKTTDQLCFQCGEKDCLADGKQCTYSDECGGKNCIEGFCSNTESCYDDNCRCPDGKIQCSDDSCVDKGAIENGAKPTCGLFTECKSNYLNSNSGICSKTPLDINTEKNRQIHENNVFLLILLALIIFWGVKQHRINIEKEDKKRSHKISVLKEKRELSEKIIEAIELKKIEEGEKVKTARKELKKVQDIVIKTKKQKENLEKLKKELNSAIKDFGQSNKIIGEKICEKKELNENLTKEEIKFTSKRKSHILGAGVYEWRNPRKDYYPCYVNDDLKTDRLIHRDLAKKSIFLKYKNFFENNYPGKDWKDLVVHHIDKNKDNYSLRNLIVISKEEHQRISHAEIIESDRESGITELKRWNISNPHIDEFVGQKKLF